MKLIEEFRIPIFNKSKCELITNGNWGIKIEKNRALYSVSCFDGPMSVEESMLIARIMNSNKVREQLHKFLLSLNDDDQTKKHEGIDSGSFTRMSGIRNIEVAYKLVDLLKRVINDHREEIDQKEIELCKKIQDLMN